MNRWIVLKPWPAFLRSIRFFWHPCWHTMWLSYVICRCCHMTYLMEYDILEKGQMSYGSQYRCQYGFQKNRMDLRNAGPGFRTIHQFILRYTNLKYCRVSFPLYFWELPLYILWSLESTLPDISQSWSLYFLNQEGRKNGNI